MRMGLSFGLRQAIFRLSWGAPAPGGLGYMGSRGRIFVGARRGMGWNLVAFQMREKQVTDLGLEIRYASAWMIEGFRFGRLQDAQIISLLKLSCAAKNQIWHSFFKYFIYEHMYYSCRSSSKFCSLKICDSMVCGNDVQPFLLK